MNALAKLRIQATWAERLPLPFETAGAIRFDHQAQFHPLRFAASLTKGLRIFENTAYRALDGRSVRTDHGSIRAEKIIVATHFPVINWHGLYWMKLCQHRSYVLALENAPDVQGMYIDERMGGLSFRNAQGMLLMGGGAHRTGKRGGGYAALEAPATDKLKV